MTLLVNLFGGPGCGKSTTRAGIFHKLKLRGYNVEEAPEYAKQLTWEKRGMALTCQPYVLGKQLFTIYRLMGQVEAIITDSPIILGSVYAPPEELPSFHQFVIDKFNSFDSINFYINRVKPYNPAGRNQDLEGAKQIDDVVLKYIQAHNIPYENIDGDEGGAIEAAALVGYMLERRRT